jgi:tetratricopeptide (TPR) repeat protein/tRNA A-37 threonylcarbamoyl transferase component Bud32
LIIVTPTLDASRDLLFGLLALQTGLINQAQLFAAFHAWTQARDHPMAEILSEQGAISAACLPLVEGIVMEHLRRHGNDPERSLAAIGVGRSTRECLAQLGNAALDASLANVGAASTELDADRTTSYAVGTATSDGQRFRLLRPHARGGLGAVFTALDYELHREVAVKQLLDHHADDPDSRQRFLIEAEVTGGLEHPGIVPVYGLGTYADGRPYYAMRFIRGDSLREAIDRFHVDEDLKSDAGRRSLELRELLRRFLDVCNAIDYAHSRGVLHRDLKPGNIIVGKHGETLVVDWGLAKATGRAEPGTGEQTLMPSSASGSTETLPGSARGTPAYMSPEQAEGDLEHLGRRSDVYSLGATLYYLLTGRPPLEGEIGEVLRAVQRGGFRPPRLLDPAIDAALEAVCLKAMALKPEDRYGSCRALAEDIERWMADEPVTAWREPVTRRGRRWARRNRTAVAAAAVALAAMVVGLGAVAGVNARANFYLEKSHKATSWALGEMRKHEAAMSADLARSIESRHQAEAVIKFLVEAFRSPEPTQDGRQVRAADVLDRASARLEKELAGSQATQGALLNALGQAYLGLGLADRAVDLLRVSATVRDAVLGPDHPDTLATYDDLVAAYIGTGQLHEAIELRQNTLRLREAKLRPDHPDTLESRNHLADVYERIGRWSEAERLRRDTLARRRKAIDRRIDPGNEVYKTRFPVLAGDLARLYPLLAGDLAGLGGSLLRQSRWTEAESLLREALAILQKATPDDSRRYQAMNLLGRALLGQCRYAEAESLIVPGYVELKAREARIPVPEWSSLREAAEGVIRLYEEWGMTEQAAVWKTKLRLPDLPTDVFTRP